MKLSCQEQLLPGASLEAKFEFASRAGFDGIEVRARGDGAFGRRLPELRAAARAGVVMPTVCPDTDHFIGDFNAERRRDAVTQLRTQLSVIAELGGAGVLTPASWGMFSLRLPPFEPPRDPAEDRAVLLEALAELAEHAAREGVWLALEPLNRYEDYMINRLEQAVNLSEAIERELGVTSIRVCADLFHMNIEEDDLPAAIHAAGWRLAHVHVDDSNRLQPGTGHMDFGAVLGALHALGYDGWLALECRLRGTPEIALPAAARFLAQHLDALGNGEASSRPEDLFAGHDDARAVYDEVRSLVDRLGPVETHVSRSQVAFRRKRGFAYIWLPGRYLSHPRSDVVLSIVLGRHDDSPRFAEVAHPAPRHWMHHLEIHSVHDIDGEVAEWLREAADHAG